MRKPRPLDYKRTGARTGNEFVTFGKRFRGQMRLSRDVSCGSFVRV